jgi:hypothetical protein
VAGKEIAIKKYVVRLSAEERETLAALIRSGKHSAQLLTKARILLKAKAGATAGSPRLWIPAWPTSSEPAGNWSRNGSKRF